MNSAWGENLGFLAKSSLYDVGIFYSSYRKRVNFTLVDSTPLAAGEALEAFILRDTEAFITTGLSTEIKSSP